jgi:hypothetical protein
MISPEPLRLKRKTEPMVVENVAERIELLSNLLCRLQWLQATTSEGKRRTVCRACFEDAVETPTALTLLTKATNETTMTKRTGHYNHFAAFVVIKFYARGERFRAQSSAR